MSRLKTGPKRQLTGRYRCDGFSLLDLLLAMAVLSIGITGLINYQKTLLFQFSYHTESQQAWRLANQFLDIYPGALPKEFSHWFSATETLTNVNECAVIKATVKSPKGIEVQLERFICSD